MAERWEMGNKNRAVGETENEGENVIGEGELGGRGVKRESNCAVQWGGTRGGWS